MNDGGPAFPRSGWEDDNKHCLSQDGLPLRDIFSAVAMLGLLSNPETIGTRDEIVKDSYLYADDMLKERSRRVRKDVKK